MPFLRQQREDDPYAMKREQPGAAPPAGRPGLAGPAAATAAAPQAPGGPTSAPGGFINLQDYLSANAGAGGAMAGKVAGSIEADAKRAAPGDAMKVQRPGALPNVVQGQDASIGWHQGQQQAAADSAQQKAGLLGTPGGQTQLLDSLYGSGRTTGESNLDNALLGGGGGNSRMGELQSRYKNFSGYVRGNIADNNTQAAGKRFGEGAELAATQRRIMGEEDAVTNQRRIMAEEDAANPDRQSDAQLSAAGYMHQQAPGESYAHYSDRVAARNGQGRS